jgi:imidazoleglycerol phosphate synthase glutamine amidotransferase subunit HisH
LKPETGATTIFAMEFPPEKSRSVGLQLLGNLAALAK